MGRLGFFGQMGRGVKPGDGILCEQKTHRQYIQPVHPVAFKSGIIYFIGEHPAEALVFGWRDDQYANNQGSAEYVPPYRNIIQQRLNLAAENIEQGNQRKDDEKPEELLFDIIPVPEICCIRWITHT